MSQQPEQNKTAEEILDIHVSVRVSISMSDGLYTEPGILESEAIVAMKDYASQQTASLQKQVEELTEKNKPEAVGQEQKRKVFVEYADFWYEVADFSNEFGVQWVHIYDEPPSKHIDRVKLSSTTGIKFQP